MKNLFFLVLLVFSSCLIKKNEESHDLGISKNKREVIDQNIIFQEDFREDRFKWSRIVICCKSIEVAVCYPDSLLINGTFKIDSIIVEEMFDRSCLSEVWVGGTKLRQLSSSCGTCD
jgi:hypothetical protein